MEKAVRDTKPVRVKETTLAQLSEYLEKSGASVAHITNEALQDWINNKMPKLLKAFS